MAEYSRLAKGSFVSTGAAQYINLPFQPDYVEFNNQTINAIPRANGVVFGSWDSMTDATGTAMISLYNGGTVYTTDIVMSNGITPYAAALSLQFGPSIQIASVNTTAPIGVTTAVPHGLANNDVVVLEGLYESPTTGMQQIAGMMFQVSNVSTNSFLIPWNGTGSNYTAISGSPAGAVVKKVLYPYLYAPGVTNISGIVSNGNGTTTVNTTTAHNFVAGQEIAFRIPPIWGASGFNSLPNNITPGSPIYSYVSSVISNTSFVVSLNSSALNGFNVNIPFSSFVGLSFPQVLAVGDVNTGGTPYSGGNLYPSPVINGVSTINGPAISGAFVNNTGQGFIIGAGTGATYTSAVLVGNSGDVIVWRAFLHDYASP